MIDLETIDEKELLANLKADKTNSEPYKTEWDTKRTGYHNEWAGKKYGNEVKGKSQVISRDIKAAQTWQHSVIKDPFVNSVNGVKSSPIGSEDTPLSEQTASVLNYQYSRDFNRYNFVTSTLKVFQVEGTVVARVFWRFEEKEIEVDEPIYESRPVMGPQGWAFQQEQVGSKKVMKTVTVVNKPDARLCKNSDLWIDPTEKENIENAKFVIERWKTSLSELKQDGKYSNLDKIKADMEASDETSDENYDDTGSFTFIDDARKELDIYEYWGNYDINDDGIAEPIVCAWIGSTIVRLEESPYSDGKVPFISCAYDAEPFSINGESNAEIVSTDQKIRTAIKRSFIDTLDKSTNGQRGFQAGTLDPINANRFKNGKDFEFQGQSPNFWEGKYNDFNPSVMGFYQTVGSEIEANTGVRAFAAGQQGGGIQSAKQVGASMDAVGKREVDVSRNYAENFIVPMLRKWNSMNADFLEPEDIQRITNKEYVAPDPMDKDGNIDIRLEVNTAESDAEKAATISFLQQTNGPNEDPRINRKLKAEMFELKNMPELAQWMREYEPPADPYVQEMKALEMKLKIAEIEERTSRAQENAVDMRLKEAKTQTEVAKTRETHANADAKDLDYVQTSDGTKHGQDMQKQQQKDNNQARNNAMNNMQAQ